jgi:cytoskeletal protein RodZ
MQTKTIGSILQEERDFHRVSLADFAKLTRIKSEYITALEANHFEELPAAPFVRGYIKTYGQTFGFDYQPLLAMLRRDYKESAKGQLVPREFIKPVLKRRLVWTPTTMTVMGLILIFLTLTSYVGWQWYNLQKPPTLKIAKPETNALVAAQVEVEGVAGKEAVVSVNSQPVELDVNGNFETQIYLPRDGINTITIEAKDRRGKSTVVQRTVRVEY